MTVRKDLTNWQPRELVLQAGQQSFDAFLAGCETRFFLLISLDEPNSELATGLLALEASRLAGETDGLAFRTVVRDLDATFATDKSAASGSTQKLPRVLTPAIPEHGRVDKIPNEMLRMPCHIVPIKKREDGGSFLQHVSVGRARNHDIVLRHRSVSKFHAWFEMHDGSRLMVKDQESRNHTFIDGQQVSNRVEVFPGQTVRFGSVDGRVCTPESLWAALHP
ncbi:MAG TPA: FHA domain-containing protein [Polyangiales bacterium]|nr:FHA domain-containing protein [Polyangiales bacterium]